MRKVWVVVANGSSAKILKAENVNKLVEHHLFLHPQSHLADRALVSDRHGQAVKKGYVGSDSMEERTSVHAKELDHFAHEIAAYLEKGFVNKEFEKLFLIAKAPFLGHLRQALTPNVAKIVEAEIAKDLMLQSPAEVREYLPMIL